MVTPIKYLNLNLNLNLRRWEVLKHFECICYGQKYCLYLKYFMLLLSDIRFYLCMHSPLSSMIAERHNRRITLSNMNRSLAHGKCGNYNKENLLRFTHDQKCFQMQRYWFGIMGNISLVCATVLRRTQHSQLYVNTQQSVRYSFQYLIVNNKKFEMIWIQQVWKLDG